MNQVSFPQLSRPLPTGETGCSGARDPWPDLLAAAALIAISSISDTASCLYALTIGRLRKRTLAGAAAARPIRYRHTNGTAGIQGLNANREPLPSRCPDRLQLASFNAEREYLCRCAKNPRRPLFRLEARLHPRSRIPKAAAQGEGSDLEASSLDTSQLLQSRCGRRQTAVKSISRSVPWSS